MGQGNRSKELVSRIILSLISAFIVGAAIFYSTDPLFKYGFLALLALCTTGALWEYFKLAQIWQHKSLAITAMIGSWVYLYAVYVSTQYAGGHRLPLIVLVLLLITLFLIHFRQIRQALTDLAVTLFGVLYITVCSSFVLLIAYFFPAGHLFDSRWWLLYLLVATKMADIGGFVVGRLCGRKKLAEKLSPRKTVEGLIGGLLFSLVGGAALFALAGRFSAGLGVSLSEILLLSVIIGFFGQMGDLAESLLKRDAGVKDSNTIPGVGGVLDMLDSLLFTAPILYLFMVLTRFSSAV